MGEEEMGETLLTTHTTTLSSTCFRLGLVLLLFVLFQWSALTYTVLPVFASSLMTALIWASTLLFILSIMTKGWYPHYLLLFLFLGSVVSVLGYLSGSGRILLIIVLAIGGASGESARAILKIFLILIGGMLGVTVLLSLLGVIPNLQYFRGSVPRYSFGLNYPTDFAAYLSYLYFTYGLFRHRRFGALDAAVGLVLAGFVFKFCDARLDAAAIVLAVVLFWVARLLDRGKTGSLMVKASFAALPVGFFLTVLLTCLYNPASGFFAKLDSLLSGRLHLGHQGFTMFPITWFGQKIAMTGNGGISNLQAIQADTIQYFFIDSSYIRFILLNGVIGLCLAVWMYFNVATKAKKCNDLFLAAALILLSVHCVVAQFYFDPSHNILILLAFTVFDIPQKVAVERGRGANLSTQTRKEV